MSTCKNTLSMVSILLLFLGVYEALELRDGGSDYLGKGVSKVSYHSEVHISSHWEGIARANRMFGSLAYVGCWQCEHNYWPRIDWQGLSYLTSSSCNSCFPFLDTKNVYVTLATVSTMLENGEIYFLSFNFVLSWTQVSWTRNGLALFYNQRLISLNEKSLCIALRLLPATENWFSYWFE